jgi:predicted N-formylglutamate amidohydrolase
MENFSYENAVHKYNVDGDGAFLIVCDHATNHVPAALHNLGVSDEDRAKHIAWDIGTERIGRQLADRFNAPAIICGTSRLVIDCNRPLTNATLVPPVSDNIRIPGNENLSVVDVGRRIESFYLPYHAAIHAAIERFKQRGVEPVFLSIHSFTPTMNGKARPWEIGISHTKDRRMSTPMIDILRTLGSFEVGDDQPYDADPEIDYTIFAHANQRGLRHVQVEFRQDVVATGQTADQWAKIFGDAVVKTLVASN